FTLQVITSRAIPMSLPGEKYRPYPASPEAELTQRSRREIRFLGRAYQDGLRPSTRPGRQRALRPRGYFPSPAAEGAARGNRAPLELAALRPPARALRQRTPRHGG